MAGNRPDFHLFLSERNVHKDKKRRYYRIGAAWWNRSGQGMMIALNPGMTIDNELLKEFSLGMFKNDESRSRTSQDSNLDREDAPPLSQEDFDDEIPF